MKTLGVCIAVAMPLALFLPCSAHAAGWSIEKNEEDPFDKSKSTFIAGTIGGSGMLAIRCLEGTVSLLVGSGPSNASAGDAVKLKIVADGKGIQEEDAEVLNATNFATAVQFGDNSTLDYLDGAQKISIRYTLGGATSTVSFSGGKSLSDVIAKTRKACGLQPVEQPKASPSAATGKADQLCEAQFDGMKKTGDLGANPDEAGFLAWCSSQTNSKP